MFIEIAYGLLGLALVALVIYMIFFLSKIGKVVDETQKTIQVLTSDVNVTLHQTNDLLAKVNVLTDDLNQKVATIDPLFTAVADLSESVSDLNNFEAILIAFNPIEAFTVFSPADTALTLN